MMPMSDREQRIWDMVFAAEFVRLVNLIGSRSSSVAAGAAHTADQAIESLRAIATEKPHPGRL
jgi:hypothetical protein